MVNHQYKLGTTPSALNWVLPISAFSFYRVGYPVTCTCAPVCLFQSTAFFRASPHGLSP
nr:MAG TPA: hypothetical protein [Bacteriophage sp.]